jgi:hypothetical protein
MITTWRILWIPAVEYGASAAHMAAPGALAGTPQLVIAKIKTKIRSAARRILIVSSRLGFGGDGWGVQPQRRINL